MFLPKEKIEIKIGQKIGDAKVRHGNELRGVRMILNKFKRFNSKNIRFEIKFDYFSSFCKKENRL